MTWNSCMRLIVGGGWMSYVLYTFSTVGCSDIILVQRYHIIIKQNYIDRIALLIYYK